MNRSQTAKDVANVWGDAKTKQSRRHLMGPFPKPNTIEVPRRLLHLPQDRFGYPIPWVSDWKGTQGKPTMWRPVPGFPEFGEYNAQEDGIGEGSPMAGNLHPGRQIRGMAKGICGACGKGVTGAFIFIGSAALCSEGFREVPVHRECAAYSIQACPGINKGSAVMVEAREYRAVPIWGDHEGNTYRRRHPFVRMPVVAVLGLPGSNSMVYTMAEWAKRTKTCPHAMLAGGFPEYSLSDPSTYPDLSTKEADDGQ